MKLKNKVALITAGGGSIGGSQAKLFAQEGAKVAVADIDLSKAKIISNQILNNAGANFRVEFEEQSESQFREIIDVGLIGSFLGIKHTIPYMKKNSNGVILNLGSLASIRPQGGSPGYASQKMGMMGLTRSAASSFAKYGIRCVLISPGHVDTPFIRDDNNYSPNGWETSIENPENYNKRLKDTPLGRLQTAEDIAKTFLFVASDDASMITGSMITVDGGAAI